MLSGQVLCPELIGRQDEFRSIVVLLDAAQARRGSTVIVLGEAGIGKSRLAREAASEARRRGMSVLSGRAVEARHPTAFRPLTEALMSTFRSGGIPPIPELEPYRPALARLLPLWRQDAPSPAEESEVVLGEGVLCLLRAIAGQRGCLLILEDVHWADPETLSVLEYLSDNLPSEPVVCMMTMRSEQPTPGLTLARSLGSRRVATLLELSHLTDVEVQQMVRACLGAPRLPEAIDRVLLAASEGLPFLVEELLATAMRSGALVRRGTDWVLATEIGPVVPQTFVDTIRDRLRSLGEIDAAVLRAAAVLGRRFEWSLIPSMARLDEQVVLAALRHAIEAQLIVIATATDGQGEFRFRHALTRDAVLSDLLPAERVVLARRALAAVEGMHPGFPGEWCELAARLSEESGELHRAATFLLETGRRALAQGALATAESVLQRARQLAVGDAKLSVMTDEFLTETLALAGKTDHVFEVGERLLSTLDFLSAEPARSAEVHLRVAQAAIAATRWGKAVEHLEKARRLAANAAESSLFPRIDALAAQAAIGEGHVDDAITFARTALLAAERDGLAEVICEALNVIGRCARLRDLDTAKAAFERALTVAEQHELRLWSIRALYELGTIDMLSSLQVGRLAQARDLAYQMGALAMVASLDLELAAVRVFRFEPEEGLVAARRCAEVARRFRLGLALPMALVHEAACHALAGRRSDMETALQEALRLEGADLNVLGGAWGSCRAISSLLDENRQRALRELATAVSLVRQRPDTHPYPFRALWALLCTIEDCGGEQAREEVRSSGITVVSLNRAYLGYADAVALGRAGQRSEAEDVFDKAEAEMARQEKVDGLRHLGRRLVAEAAIADGWGDPSAWLREAARFFESSGHRRVVVACRSLLRKAGTPLSRKGRGQSEVPAALQALGVTSREMDVLVLLAGRHSNKEIAALLYLSPRTVEKHVERLMARTGARDRVELADFAERAGVLTRTR